MNKGVSIKLKTANAEAHLKVVLKDVDIANQELSKVLEQVKYTKSILKEYSDSIEEKKEINSFLIKENEEELRKIELARNSLIELSNEIDNKSHIVDSEIEKKKAIIIDLENKFNSNLAYYKDSIDTFEIKISSLNENISKLETIESDLLGKIGVSQKELLEITNEITKKTEEKRLLDDEFNRFVAKSKKEREEIINQIEVEKQKIQIPMQSLLIKENEISSRERNVGVLIRRYRTAFSKTNPGQTPSI